MENKIINLNNNEDLTIDSREVATMGGIAHKDLIKKLEGAKDRIGIIPTLTKAQMSPSDFFIESTYVDSTGRSNKCYLFTKKGCEFIANKFTGEKGILFTAKYVKRFNQMEKSIKDCQLTLANKEIKELKETVKESKIAIEDFKKSIDDAKAQFKPSHKTKLRYDKLIKSVTENKEEYDIVKTWVFAILKISKWEEACVNDNGKILKTIATTARLLSIKKFEQLSLF